MPQSRAGLSGCQERVPPGPQREEGSLGLSPIISKRLVNIFHGPANTYEGRASRAKPASRAWVHTCGGLSFTEGAAEHGHRQALGGVSGRTGQISLAVKADQKEKVVSAGPPGQDRGGRGGAGALGVLGRHRAPEDG